MTIREELINKLKAKKKKLKDKRSAEYKIASGWLKDLQLLEKKEQVNKLKAETQPLNIKCVNANCTILGTSGGGKHYDGIKGATNEASIN